MLISDLQTLVAPEQPEPASVDRYLDSRGITFTTWEGWELIDSHEISLGGAEGRIRVKVVPRDEMVRIARG